MAMERREHSIHHVGLLEIARREVHAHAQIAEALPAPPANCRQDWSRTQSLMRPIKPASSATGMKLAGSSSPRCGCRQRISASMPTTCRRLTLIWGWYHSSSSPVQRPPQFVLQRELLMERRVHFGREKRVAVLARGLDVIHRDVGVLDQALGVLAVSWGRARCRCSRWPGSPVRRRSAAGAAPRSPSPRSPRHPRAATDRAAGS